MNGLSATAFVVPFLVAGVVMVAQSSAEALGKCKVPRACALAASGVLFVIIGIVIGIA